MVAGFNPRARDGRDKVPDAIDAGWLTVSIHAPVMGATHTLIQIRLSDYCFNPRARDGRDFRLDRESDAIKMFQSTRP